MSAFDFLSTDFPLIYEETERAIDSALPDPRTSLFYSRRTIEQAVRWAFKADLTLSLGYNDTLGDLLNDPTFKALMGTEVFHIAKEVVRQGNQAVHEDQRVTQRDSITTLSGLFQFCFWFARTYGTTKPVDDLKFDPRYLPRPQQVQEATSQQIVELQKALEAAERERELALEAVGGKTALEEEIKRLQAEVTEAKRAAAATPDAHDYSEAETRKFLIDALLAESGWPFGVSTSPQDGRDVEFEVTPMPNNENKGFADYVLWGDDGLPLAVVEAKKTQRDPNEGKHQAFLYAEALEAMYGQRPVIFYTNGFQHWIWDDHTHPARAIQGFYTKDELQLLVQRRTSKVNLRDVPVSPTIVERYYQRRCIANVTEAFEAKHRKALVVMATGAGKTRTVIALSDVLIRANWAKRILFLADRVALVNQATNAFKTFLPDSSPVNLVTEKATESRVYVSTYQTMMSLINEMQDGQRRFGPGHFDLIVIDEAHRSVFKKYKAIFDYFDSQLIGLTATPKDEVNHNTYALFDLDPGMPTDVYSLEEAVHDGFLVDFESVEVPSKFIRQGISYDELTPDEQEAWDEMDWGDGEEAPDEIDAAALNKWLFNTDTVDKILEVLMINGIKVDGGDILGKTIIFAKNQRHADFIEERFNLNYPHLRGKFARTITYNVEYAQDLIDKFSIKDGDPNIAVTVDMLDTGIDVPEVVNLVFFKPLRSKTKFWQMIGRGTRLCPDLFGPGDDKKKFLVFDCCRNFEYFRQDPKTIDGLDVKSVNERRFIARLELLGHLAESNESELLGEIAASLHEEVASMNPENFVVRPHREMVAKFTQSDAWSAIDEATRNRLADELAPLPNQLPSEHQATRRFDLTMLDLQLAVVTASTGFERLRDQVKGIASVLENYTGIPAIAREIDLLSELQTDEWWENITLGMLDDVRKRLRALVPFIEKSKQQIVYTNFTDELGDIVAQPSGMTPALSNFSDFRKKAHDFLQKHLDTVAILKLRTNTPINAADIEELQKILLESGVGRTVDFERAEQELGDFGTFIRSLVGLDHTTAKEVFGSFLAKSSYTVDQINFINLVINDLTQNGVVTAARFYDAPYTAISAVGPQALFTPEQIQEIDDLLESVRRNAMYETKP